MLDILILGFSIAGLCFFLRTCMSEGMIFEWWYLFIEKKLSKTYNYSKKYVTLKHSFFKILGGCIFCYSFYVATVFWILFSYNFDYKIIFFFPYIGIVETFIYIFIVYLEKD